MPREVWFQLVDGDGNAVTSADCIDCAENAKVFRLRDAVKLKCPNALANVDAADLTVFANRAAYDAKQALDPRSTLAILDENETIIVRVPQRAGVSSERSATRKKIDEMHEKLVQTKRKLYVHSKVGSHSSEGRDLLRDLNIKVEPVQTVPFAAGNSTPVQAFGWEGMRDERGRTITLTEEQQRERYRSYVEDNIGSVLAEKELCVLGVENGRNILSVAVPGYDIDLKGRTDMLVLSALAQTHRRHLDFLPGVRMLIEVKKKVESGSMFQALSELIALDLLTEDPVMALLTDLTEDWQFFWVSERSSSHAIIHTAILTTPGEAFQVIRTLLAQTPGADADITLPWFGEPVKRRKLVNMLPAISEGGESSSGIRAAIERYYDITSMLGPDIDMARAAASQIVRAIPVLSYYT